MNDLISRQTAIDALGERPLVWSKDDDYSLGGRSQYDIDRLAIETVPSAQPEIIRCEECRYNTGLSKFIEDYYNCDHHEQIVRAYDFCSHAEKRKEGDE